MLKNLIFLLTLTLPLQIFASSEIQRIKNIKTYLSQVEKESADTLLTEAGNQFKLSFQIFAEAIAAAGEPCFYGGWPSKKVMSGGRSLCTSPINGSDIYSAGSCLSHQIQCQPQLFGANLCVGFATKQERINTFKNCEDSFVKEKRDYNFVQKLNPQELEQLKAIEALASDLCKSNPSRSTSAMCEKILSRVKATKFVATDADSDDDPVFMAPVDEEEELKAEKELKLTNPSGLTDAECAAIITNDFDKINQLSQQVAGIMSKFGEDAKWPREDQSKGKVIDLQEEVLCLELEIYSLSNKLNLQIDCKAKPKKLPPMHMSLVKHSESSTFDEIAEIAINKKLKYLDQIANNQEKTLIQNPNLSQSYKDQTTKQIAAYRAEATCLRDIDVQLTCADSYTELGNLTYQTKGDFVSQYGGTPLVTMFVEKDGKLLPFKKFDQLIVQAGVGPKIKQGDMMTPEGVFNIVNPTTSTNYFTASRLDYENWKERKDMLAGLPNSMISPGDKGGAILIHGSGGSNGCLSFDKNSESAYFTALSRNKTKNGEKLKMSVYPAEMSEELIESSNSIPKLKIYKNFWNKLSVSYNKDKKRTISSVKTINEITADQ